MKINLVNFDKSNIIKKIFIDSNEQQKLMQFCKKCFFFIWDTRCGYVKRKLRKRNVILDFKLLIFKGFVIAKLSKSTNTYSYLT
jgi:hypothetical protein